MNELELLGNATEPTRSKRALDARAVGARHERRGRPPRRGERRARREHALGLRAA